MPRPACRLRRRELLDPCAQRRQLGEKNKVSLFAANGRQRAHESPQGHTGVQRRHRFPAGGGHGLGARQEAAEVYAMSAAGTRPKGPAAEKRLVMAARC